MVDRSYMLARPPPPSPVKRFVDQSAIPVLIDAAGSVEAQLERAAVAARKAPVLMLGAAFGVGWLLGILSSPRLSDEHWTDS